MTDNPKMLWRKQEAEDAGMGLEQVKARLAAFQAKVRRERAWGLLIGLAGAAMTAWVWTRNALPLVRAGDVLLGLGYMVIIVRVWKRPPAGPIGDGADCVAFLRAQLRRRRRMTSGGWIRLIAPLLPGLAVMLLGLAQAAAGRLQQLTPILALLALWLVVMLVLQRRGTARIDAEIAALDRLR
jgi:hypothetical protein